MRKLKFTEEKILKILERNKNGSSIPEICKEYSISQATFYNWRKKYKGFSIDEVQKLKTLEEENSRLKKSQQQLEEENQALKDLIKKKL